MKYYRSIQKKNSLKILILDAVHSVIFDIPVKHAANIFFRYFVGVNQFYHKIKEEQ